MPSDTKPPQRSLLGPPRLAGAGLALGIAACAVGAAAMSGSIPVARIASALGVAVLVLGVATLIFDSEWMLAAFVGSVVLLWTIATVRHLTTRRAEPAERPADRARAHV